MVRKVFLALFMVLGALPLFAAKYYIDPNLGVDVRTKTQAQLFYYPWKHIQTGIDSANVGDTISLADAPFPESITITKRICIFGRVSTVSIINYPASAGTGTVVTIAPGVDGVYLKNLAIDGRYQFTNGALNGVVCGVGVDSLRMTGCAIRNCGASGVLTSYDSSPDGAVNEGFHIENCSFQNILAGQGTALHSCAIWGDHLSHAYIRANTFYKCGIGIWISGTTLPDTSAGTGNVISSNAIHDLTQNGLIAAGIYNSVIDSNVVERCAGFIRPDSAWSRMYVGSVSFVGGATNVAMVDNVVRDNNGYIGIDTFYTDQAADTVETPGYNGWPGIFFRGGDTVIIHHGSIFGNNFGGMYISGSAPHVTIDSCFFYSNGNLNDSNEDYAISAPFANVDARSNWWGVSTGPVFDGNGVGNGIYGDSIAVDPVMSSSIYHITFAPQSIIFYVVHLGGYQDTTFDFYNAGPGPAFTSAPYIGGSSTSQFAIISPTSPQIIEPFDTLHVTVHFQPTEVGLLQAIAAIATDTSTIPFGPQLYGFGGLAVLSTSDTLKFDTLAPGRCIVKTIPLKNIGTEVLGIGNIAVTGPDSSDFSVLNVLPTFIPSGFEEDLQVEFCPTSIGKKSATLLLSANTLPTQTPIQLIGASAVVSRIVPGNTSIALGTYLLGTHADSAFIVRNTASRAMVIDSVYFVNDADGEFSLLAPQLPDTVGVGSFDIFRFRFSAAVRGGKSVTLRAVCDDGTIFTVAITAYGGVVQVTKLPDTLFKNVVVLPGSSDTERCLEVLNSGDFPVGVFLAAIGGASAGDYSLLPYQSGTVAPGKADTVCVQYHPSQVGSSPAYLLLQYTDPSLGLDTIILVGRSSTTGVSDAGIVTRSPLENYPNPFSSTTTIAFHVTHGGPVALNIYNVLGDKVATVISQDALPGDYTVQWDARDLPRGIYFCRGVLNGQEYVRALDVVK